MNVHPFCFLFNVFLQCKESCLRNKLDVGCDFVVATVSVLPNKP